MDSISVYASERPRRLMRIFGFVSDQTFFFPPIHAIRVVTPESDD